METPPAEGEAAESRLCLLLAQPENVPEMNLRVMKRIIASGCVPLIVSVNKPCKVLSKMYAKEGIAPDAYYIIDAVTQYSGGECVPGPKTRYVTNPSNLTDLGIAITEILKQMPDRKKCILFDSVSMLLIHIPSITASKFLHFVVNRLKLSDVSGVFLCAEKGLDPVILSQMSSFVDHITDFEKSGTDTCIL
jgi:hypothetical protein